MGIFGFVPNPLIGDGALFHTNATHNVVHLLVGLVFLLAAFVMPAYATLALKGFGYVYLLIAVLGFLVVDPVSGEGSILGFVDVNGADNWLHVVLGALLVALGFMAKSEMPIRLPSFPTQA